ncbi:lytic transglycosylase domain-containing protein [Streptomyces sp. NPDC006450]|uniref:lytic transglycosylase domain-containing protein n=1 Tax=Streptomyces sp. NPDC006450 TaxID=3155458 RepID=UPI0033B1467E
MKPLHRHLVNTSRKVMCTAALAASLTTAAVVTNTPIAGAGEAEPTPDSPQATDRGDARLDLPDLVADPPPAPPGAASPGGATAGIPATALDAYKRAEISVAAALPGCHLPWQLLAGIGRVESVHASGYGLKADGYTEKPIRGPRLDGNGFAEIKDTDKGEWDADTEYDRAVGPMQFIPSTWSTWGADGNADSKRDPNNIYDAALGAGLYLCAGQRNLTDAGDLDKAILSYNRSREYVNTVLGYMRQYQAGQGATPVPNPPSGNYPTPNPPTLPTPPAPPAPVPPPTPTPTPTPPVPPTPTPTPTPKPTLDKLVRIGTQELTAEAGTEFARTPLIKAVLTDGMPAVDQVIVISIDDDTTGHTVFAADGKDFAVLRTNAKGLVRVPKLKAGRKEGAFTVRASGYAASSEVSVRINGKVTPAKPVPVPEADQIVRSDANAGKPLTAVAGTGIKGVQFLATAKDKPVAGAKATAGLGTRTADGKWVPADPAKAGETPYFLDKDGKKLTELALPATGADGKIALPELSTTGVAAGTYTLRVRISDQAVLFLEITVTEPPVTEPPVTEPPVTEPPATEQPTRKS